MKKIFLFLTAVTAFTISSCSSDDDGPSGKKLTAMTINDGTAATYNISYNSDDRISSVVRTEGGNAVTYTFAYDDGLLTTITASGDDTGLTTFSYDSNDRLNNVNLDGTDTPVVYNNGTYSVSGIQYTLNSRGDINTVFSTDLYTFNYDTSKKGPFNNARGTIHILGIFMQSELLFYATKKPLDSITAVTQADYAYVNVYDEDGYLTSTALTFDGDAESTATFTYED